MDLMSTIVAVSSPPGRSTRGLVRTSGTAALALARSVGAIDFADEPRGLYRGRFDLGSTSFPVLVLIFRGPRSYTGDDIVEFFAPGHPVLLERMVDRLIDIGTAQEHAVRRAEPGEFTARAFFRGRLTLTQADGVAATISARSDAELRAAHLMSNDALGQFALELAGQLARALALVEAGIDFTDAEDVVPIAPADLCAELTAMKQAIAAQLDGAVGTEVLEAIPWVALAGPPNAGKSTLFNALLRRPRAIVSPERGTTRDVLVEPLVVSGAHGPAEVLLADVAGEEDGVRPIERAMQEARHGAQQRAELVLRCVPPDEAPPDAGLNELIVLTKRDLRDDAMPVTTDSLAVCARSGDGVDELRRAIATRLADRAVSLSGGELVLRPRHDRALRLAEQELDAAQVLAQSGGLRTAPELVAAALRLALDEIGVLAGTMSPDDVLDHVFGSFCIGK